MSTILVLNGPNLNLLGKREPKHYGQASLDDISRRLKQTIEPTGHQIDFRQSNSEQELIEWIHASVDAGVKFIIFNPAAFTHTSVALRDALLAVGIPFIEVHLSNVHGRESFRRHSYFSDIAEGVISGLGATGYELALQTAISRLDG